MLKLEQLTCQKKNLVYYKYSIILYQMYQGHPFQLNERIREKKTTTVVVAVVAAVVTNISPATMYTCIHQNVVHTF